MGRGDEWPNVRARYRRPGRFRAGQNYYIANFWSLVTWPAAPIRVPVTGVYSSGDRYLVEAQMTMSERLVTGGWRYVRLDDMGHWMQLDAPERVNELLLGHLAMPV